jgi:predicted O-linked N-acetylglucosamine transferase (SPINDLY family)
MELELKNKNDVLKLQQIVANKLNRGEIISKDYILLYNKLKNFEIPKNEVISKNIEFLEKHYDKLTKDEKYLVNNLLFALEILNGNAKEGLEKAANRVLQLNIHEIENNPEIMFFIDFLQQLDDDKFLIQILKKIYKQYFSFPYEKRRHIIANTLVIFWNNKHLYINKLWLDFFDTLEKTFQEAIKREEIDDVMPLHFLAYHIYGNNIHTIDEWRIFNKRIEKKASIFYKNWADKNNIKPNKKGNKKRIGFLIDRIVLNSPFMVFYSLLKNLMENEEFKKNYEIYIYSMEYIYKQPDDEKLIQKLSSLGVKVYTPIKFRKDGYHFSHIAKALDLRKKIIDDKIYYLINQVSGYDISNFLFSTRTTPKQIYWSHGNCAFDIEGIDKRISHFDQECKEFEWEIFDVPLIEEFLVGNKDEKAKGEEIKKSIFSEFGENTVILGTIGRLVKIDNEEYLNTIAEIMKNNPNTVYIACGVGGKSSVEKKIEKLGIDKNRFIFTGMVNPHIWGWVIDVWPETFPLRQGQSRNEYEAKGGAIIGYKKYYSKGAIKTIENFAKELEIESPLAKNLDEYVELTTKAIKDKEYREKLGTLYKKVREKYSTFDIEKFKKAIGAV